MLDSGHVTQSNGHAIDIANHNIAELFGLAQIGGCRDVELTHLALYPASRHFDIGLAQSVLNVLGGQAVGSKSVGIEPNPHGVLAFTKNTHIRHTRRGLHHRLGNAVGQVGELQGVHGVGTEGQPNDWLCIRFNLGDDGLIDAHG